MYRIWKRSGELVVRAALHAIRSSITLKNGQSNTPCYHGARNMALWWSVTVRLATGDFRDRARKEVVYSMRLLTLTAQRLDRSRSVFWFVDLQCLQSRKPQP